VTTAIGVASGTKASRIIIIHSNDIAQFSGLDLFCTEFSSDPDKNESGPIVACQRVSLVQSRGRGRGMGASRYHMWLTTADGQHILYKVTRSP
jgi:hypothetical protein